jgi:WD40 repeat protein
VVKKTIIVLAVILILGSIVFLGLMRAVPPWFVTRSDQSITTVNPSTTTLPAIVDDSNKVILASPDAARVIRTIDKMQSPVWDLLFSPDGSLLAATDGTENHIWRVDDGELLLIGKAACL